MIPEEGQKAGLERLFRAQLALAGLSALILIGFGPDATAGASGTSTAIYLTILLLGVCAGAAHWIGPRVGSVSDWASILSCVDCLGVTALLYLSGDLRSGFVFLYPVIALYGATFLSRPRAWGLASVCGAAYGSLLVLAFWGLVPGVEAVGDSGFSEAASWRAWLALMGALALAVLLSGRLSSELQSTGEALHESTRNLGRLNDLHDQIIGSITSGLLTTGPRGQISSFNPEAERITGFSQSDVMGRPLDEIIPGAHVLIGRRGGRKSRVQTRTRLEYRNASGVSLFLGVASSRLISREGRPRGHVVIFQDVSEVVGMEDALRRTERMAAVGEMAAKIAHEIRSPLASIAGSVQLMVSTGAIRQETEEAGRLTDVVLRESQRLNALIMDFLQYSRPISPLRKELRLDHVVREVMVSLEASCPDTISMSLSISEPVMASADSEHLKQALWNIATNALEAMPDGGELEFVIRRCEAPEVGDCFDLEDGPWAEVCIRDSGPGVDVDVEGRIFEPFFTTKAGGSGLGLATVHQIVEAHGGSVRVENSTSGGAVFRVRLRGIESVS